MVTHFYDEFDVDHPKVHPMTGDLILTYIDTDAQHRHVFPIPKDDAEAYYEAIGDALGKTGPKIQRATMEDVKNATRTR
jgi:hypothetical protein